MKGIPMHKAVRDKIPEIIAKDGQAAIYEIMPAEAWPHFLVVKLKEETNEYAKSEEVEELADILEIIYALAELSGVSRSELEVLRKKKARGRGGFEKRIYLKEIRTEL